MPANDDDDVWCDLEEAWRAGIAAACLPKRIIVRARW